MGALKLIAGIILAVVLGVIVFVVLLMITEKLLRLLTLTSVADSIENLSNKAVNGLLGGIQKTKYVTVFVLLFVAVVYAYLNFESIDKPIRFQKEYQKRYDRVVERLKDIRSTQVAYKSMYGEYAGSLDSLIEFVLTDSLVMIRQEGSVDDSLLIKRSMKEAEAIAIERGYIVRDTAKVTVLDSLFKGDNKRAENLRYIPNSNGEEFEMEAGEVETTSKVKVKVFEARAPYEKFLKDLDRQLVVNVKEEAKRLNRYVGLKVGDINEASNNEGNWE